MAFQPGAVLAQTFYTGTIRPVLGLPHSAGLLGPGSDVLGYDTARSTDHDWGPRVTVFVAAPDRDRAATRLRAVASTHTTPLYGRVRTGVTLAIATDWYSGQLGFDPTAAVTLADWLSTPTQLLAEVTRGPVFHDGLGVLTTARANLAWYPDDVWRYVLACNWLRIAQEEAFVGRAGEVGDELGAGIVAARLARDLVRLWLLMQQSYPPYSKWLGTALGSAELRDPLTAAIRAQNPGVREESLCRAYTLVAQRHNVLGLTPPLDPTPRGYFDRPYRVLGADRFTDALLATVTDPAVRALPRIGAVDQFVDSTDVLSHADRARRFWHNSASPHNFGEVVASEGG
jgi:hypothetical protein